MRRRLVAVFAAILLLLLSSSSVLAGNSAYHNGMLSRMLFRGGTCLSTSQESNLQIEMLQNAVYLAVDQSGNKSGDQGKLDALRNNGVKGIATEIATLNPEVDFLHRSYTHRGWDWVYTNDKSNWSERKKILLNTAEEIFNFSKYCSSSSEAEKKRDAFCKILYYQHILGDLIYDDKDTITANLSAEGSEIIEKERGLIIAFAYAHPGSTNKDVFWELSDAFKTLFSSQENSYKYSGFMSKFNSLAREARSFAGQTGGVNTTERIQQRLSYEEELLDLMESYLPLLLDDEAFFRAAFPI